MVRGLPALLMRSQKVPLLRDCVKVLSRQWRKFERYADMAFDQTAQMACSWFACESPGLRDTFATVSPLMESTTEHSYTVNRGSRTVRKKLFDDWVEVSYGRRRQRVTSELYELTYFFMSMLILHMLIVRLWAEDLDCDEVGLKMLQAFKKDNFRGLPLTGFSIRGA